jgi:hypothetical protein
MKQIGLLLRGVGVLHRLTERPQPGHSAIGRHPDVRGLIERRELGSEFAEPAEIGPGEDVGRGHPLR